MTSSLSGVKYGAAHCEYLQRYIYFYKEGIQFYKGKTNAPKISKG